jgi:hypothetical protein
VVVAVIARPPRAINDDATAAIIKVFLVLYVPVTPGNLM